MFLFVRGILGRGRERERENENEKRIFEEREKIRIIKKANGG